MKIVTAREMSRIEQKAVDLGKSMQEFMEEAGSGIALCVHNYLEAVEADSSVVLLCGKGNNAGDAFVAGLQLLQLDYEVVAYHLYPIEECSSLCQQECYKFIAAGGVLREYSTGMKIEFPVSGAIIDGIFGSGFRGSVEDPARSVILQANGSGLPIFAVDIPSGLDGDTGSHSPTTIMAHSTLALGLPKVGYFIKKGWRFVGELALVEFGLDAELIEQVDQSPLELIDESIILPLLPPVYRDRHKYEVGEVIGIAGSPEMPGAAQLASSAALGSGAGIVRLLHPRGMELQLTASPFELIRIPFDYDHPEKVLEMLNKADSGFIGPGLGISPETVSLVHYVLNGAKVPLVIDADALNVIASSGCTIPPGAILTPHLGELKKLLHIDHAELDFPLFNQCQDYAERYGITLILKGGPTFIFHPGSKVFVSSRGSPGMASAGTGDVLTGLLAGLLAQKLNPLDAALLGVYLHGVAGEFAAAELTPYCMTASDIIQHLPDAFQKRNLYLPHA